MLRLALLALASTLALPSYAASLSEYQLTQKLEQVAQTSSQGTPRAINADLLDQGYSVDGNQLINHISVRASHAEQMRSHPDAVRSQLAASVCKNAGYRQLLSQGAELVYDFSEHHSNRPVAVERFVKADCALK